MPKEGIRVVVIGTRGFPDVQGGVETHCENLYPILVEKGCEVFVLTRKPYVNADINTFKGVNLVPLSCIKNRYLETISHIFLGLFTAIRLKPDILHIHAIGPSLIAPIARLFKFKVVVTNHGPDYERKKWGWFAKSILLIGERLGCRYANAVICISDHIAADIKAKYNCIPVIIPNGVATTNVVTSHAAPDKFGLKSGHYIMAVGRFVPEKAFHDLVEAFIILDERNPSLARNGWKLVLVGAADHESSYSGDLRNRAQTNSHIVMTGFLSGLPLIELYSHAGLFVIPSYYEGLPIALLEALSHGLSCIASDIPANIEVGLSPDRYFKTGDIASLGRKIEYFILNPMVDTEKKNQIAEVSRKYDWRSKADKTLSVYKHVLHQTERIGS